MDETKLRTIAQLQEFLTATPAMRGVFIGSWVEKALGSGIKFFRCQHLSPLGWEHINLTGDYLWRSSAKVGAGRRMGGS